MSRDREAPRREKDDGPRINGAISARQVRVIDANGEMRGVMTVREGIALAEEAGLTVNGALPPEQVLAVAVSALAAATERWPGTAWPSSSAPRPASANLRSSR